MKFATWLADGAETAGVLAQDGQSVHSFASAGLAYASLLDFIARHTEADLELLRNAVQKPGVPLQGVRLLAPIPRPHHDIICVGLNYMDHARESANFDIKEDPDREDAVYFSKRVHRALGPDGEIENHPGTQRLDYEAELGVVIGREGRGIPPQRAFQHVFGLCCFNDISGRELQKKHKQWFVGKSQDSYTAFGPYIVTLDEFELPLRLHIQSRVNGEMRQDSNTENMIFSVQHVISELSQGITLDAGSIIATGTPAGVGAGFTPHRCMQPGDVVEVEIEGCGVLRNVVAGGDASGRVQR